MKMEARFLDMYFLHADPDISLVKKSVNISESLKSWIVFSEMFKILTVFLFVGNVGSGSGPRNGS